MACIVCDDRTFGQQLFHIFNGQVGKSIAAIGDLDVSHLL